MMRRATWCGIVFALAVLITVLNIVPPVDVTYHVVSQAVISETRLAQLENQKTVTSVQVAGETGNSQSPQVGATVVNVKILDRTQGDGLSTLNSPIDKHLVLVEVKSKWPQRCDEAAYSDWFEATSRGKSISDEHSDIGKQLRQARWELQVAEHYAAQQQFLNKTIAASDSTDGRTFQLASATNPSTDGDEDLDATLSTFRLSNADDDANNQFNSQADNPPVRSEEVADALIAQVTTARQKVSDFELAWQRQIQQSSGDVRLSGAIQLVATPTTIPGWMAASILIVGLASGASAGWLQHRMQSGGVHDPEAVARQLGHVGVPAVGKLEIADVRGGNDDWMERASTGVNTTGRRLARNLTTVSEACVGFWIVVILVRLASDPLWRTVLLESPLAALGRLIVGMP